MSWPDELQKDMDRAYAVAKTLHSATLKPAPGRVARHEDGRPLAAEGEEVALNPWWMRRLIDQDVEIVGAPPPVAAAAITPAPRRRRGKSA